jgi:hypothetical protein
MGSELVDADGMLLWGLRPRLLARQLTHGDLLRRLRVTPDDNVRASALVRTPALIPGLGSLDPYTPLVLALRNDILNHPDALLEFPYDWRRSISDSATKLAGAAEMHLKSWRNHARGHPEARLWLVCHSLGGLVARYFTEILEGRQITHETITLGTPHYGSLDALAALANGDGFPFRLLAQQVRALARSMPSMYEMIPRYACVTNVHENTPRRLSATDIDALGGLVGLAQAAEQTHRALDEASTATAACPVRTRVGITQPTAQTCTIMAGIATLHESIEGEDRRGDGRVYRDAATPIGVRSDPIPQRHGRLASAPEAIAYVHAALTERPQGPPMAALGGIGMDVPGTIEAGGQLLLRIVGDPSQRVRCNAIDQDSGRQVAAAVALANDGILTARLTIPRPGVYSIQAKSGGYSAVGEIILATEPHMS